MEYEINNETLAIIPVNPGSSKVYESDNQYLIPNNTLSVIEHSCEYFGSTYQGRYAGTKSISGLTHKSPIIIEELSRIIFFPTTSPNNPECAWISLNNILSFQAGDTSNTSVIYFKNGNSLVVNISLNSLKNQIFRASRLKCLFDDRINDMQKKYKNI